MNGTFCSISLHALGLADFLSTLLPRLQATEPADLIIKTFLEGNYFNYAKKITRTEKSTN